MAGFGDGQYKVRKGASLPYNDGTGPKVAHAGDTVTLPRHLAEGEFAARLEHLDGRPMERSRWSLADINRASPAERKPMIEGRIAGLDREKAELAKSLAVADAETAQQASANAQRRVQLKGV